MPAAQPTLSCATVPGASADLAAAVRVARLVGADPALVLFGGGNTSVKVTDGAHQVLYVKGSGADLAHVTESDYTPLALTAVRALLDADLPDNRAMYDALAPHVLRESAPRPSIETMMHAGLPAAHVIHTHAAAVLAIANTVGAAHHLAAAFGAAAPVVPYRHSGVDLARACVGVWRRADPRQACGLVLAHHGALTCGRDADEACARMLAMAERAERYLAAQGAPRVVEARRPGDASPVPARLLDAAALMTIARLRDAAGRVAGRKLVGTRRGGAFIDAFVRRTDLATLAAQGPSTPGHAIWTKRVPQIGSDVAAFATAYRAYLDGAEALDCAPRVVLDAAFGLVAFGVTKRHADIAAAVFVHDAAIMVRAAALGGYATIGAGLMRSAELEYAGFEARVARTLPRAGQVHVIDRACARAEAISGLLAAGAAVAGIDRDPAVARLFDQPGFLGLIVQAPDRLKPEAIIEAFGGIDHADVGAGFHRQLAAYVALAHD